MVALLAPPTLSAQERTIRVTGVVRDDANAIAIPGVPVELVGTGMVVYTDVDGRYVLQVTPGSHRIKVSLDGYQERLISFEVSGERTITADVGLTMNRLTETVVVSAAVINLETSTAEAQMIERKQAQVITDNLGAQEMRRNGDSDAAAAMARVTGLSLVDDFVFVRGLGERYSNTTLNGAVVPTTEPDRKVVPLDLFPAGLIDNVQVAKSYAPDRSAEFAGGLVQIEPLKFPTGPTVDVSYGLAFNSLTTGKDVLGSAGGGRDWVGYDDGIRALPSGLETVVRRGGIFTPDVGYTRAELERIGERFRNSWTPIPRTALPGQNVGAVLGNRFGKLGVLVSYTQSYKEQAQSEKQIYYRTGGAGLSEFSNYDFAIATRRANVGAVANVAYQFTPAQRISLENFYTHSGKDDVRTFEGFNSDIATEIFNTRAWWIEEDLTSTTLSGEHFAANLANSRFDWRLSYAKANRDEPDLREVLRENNGGVFVLADESQSGFRMFNTLDDQTTDVGGNWALAGTQSGLPMQLKFGASYVDRTRDFSSRRFRFVPVRTTGLDLSRPIEELLTPATIGPNYEIKEETRPTDAYDATQTVTSFYAMTDLSISSSVRLVGGARIERFDQEVNTFDLFDLDGTVITANLENTDVFPAANLVLGLTPDQNLRVSFSQTVNRPEFRELAPFEFTDIVGGRAVVGNAGLKRALIQNVDVRWEMFPGGDEVLAASFFYKHFNDPIERIVEPTAQLRTSFTNADSARNVGLELEARRRFAGQFMIGANYTFVDSKIALSGAATEVQTSLERALAGQSKNLFNVVFEAGSGAPVTGRLLYNFFGARISDVGSLGLPDIFEDSRGTLDVVLSGRWRALNLRFSAENLTDEAYTFTQGDRLQREYKLGRSFSLGVGVALY
jgi:outer membrane receptor protein involved in Fe transport